MANMAKALKKDLEKLDSKKAKHYCENTKILYKALELQKEYPLREIKLNIDSDIFTDDFGWYSGNFTNAELSMWYNNEDEILTDEDAIRDYLYDKKEDQMRFMSENEREREIESTIEEMKDSGEILDVILIRVGV